MRRGLRRRMGPDLWADPWAPPAGEEAEIEAAGSPRVRAASRRLLRSVLRPHRWDIAAGGVLLVLNTAAVLTGPYLVKYGIDEGIAPLLRVDHGPAALGSLGTLNIAVVAFLGAAMADALTARGYLLLIGRASEGVLFDLRTRLFGHLQRLSLDFYERMKSGRIISRMTSDVEALYELLSNGMVAVVTNGLVLLGITVILLRLNVELALVTLSIIPVLLLATTVFRERSERAYRVVREKIALVIMHMAESLNGIRVVQAFAREPVNQKTFEDVNGQHRDATAETVRLMSLYGPGMEFLGQVALFVVLLYGGFQAVGGGVTVGVLAAFILYLRQFFEPIQELSQFYNTFQAGTAGLEKIAMVLEEKPTVRDRPDAVELPLARGEIVLEGVTFAYEREPVLHEVDLRIAAGETVALVGPTGAGKSTVAKLIARFYDPTRGRVAIDGHDLRDVRIESLRRQLAIVPQEGYLFSGTIRDNIAYGRPGASDQDIDAAAWAVGAHAFIAGLPEGYDTDVQRRGGRLSAGQRQLISFARAWLADPRIIILDEATSALDLPAERAIQRALQSLLADRTAVIIAHRLTTVSVADRIVMLEEGRVVEAGSPEELLGRPGRFRELHALWEASLRTR